jgi:hypothetical protein
VELAHSLSVPRGAGASSVVSFGASPPLAALAQSIQKLLVANTPSLPQCGELFQPFPEVSFLSLQHTGRRERRGEGTPALHSRSGSGASRAAGKFCAAASSIPSSDNLVGCCSRRSKRRRAFGMCVTSPVRARACVLLFHLGDSLQSLLCVSLASRV